MPTSLISTGVQFPDNSIQTTAATGGGDYIALSYVSPATWTKPAALKAVRVTVLGGGGAGGNASTIPGPSQPPGKAGGGGSGAYAQAYYDAPAIPGPLTVTAGPGTNSFGALVSCTGGAGASPVSATTGSGGSGGSYTPSPATIIAQNGFAGAAGAATASSTNAGTGFGSNTFAGLGFGGPASPTPTTTAGGAAIGYGSGGGGGARTGAAGTTPGGAGAPGIVIVEEFY